MKESRSGFMISQIRHIGGRVFQRVLSQAGVDAFNGPQGRILDALWREDCLPASRLSDSTGLARNTLTSMLDRMEAAGLVARLPDSHDRRVTLIRLTEKARAFRDKYEDVSRQMNGIYFKGFSDDEIMEFEGYLSRIIANLTEVDSNE